MCVVCVAGGYKGSTGLGVFITEKIRREESLSHEYKEMCAFGRGGVGSQKEGKLIFDSGTRSQ